MWFLICELIYSRKIQRVSYGTKYGLFLILPAKSYVEDQERFLSDQEIIEHIVVSIQLRNWTLNAPEAQICHSTTQHRPSVGSFTARSRVGTSAFDHPISPLGSSSHCSLCLVPHQILWTRPCHFRVVQMYTLLYRYSKQPTITNLRLTVWPQIVRPCTLTLLHLHHCPSPHSLHLPQSRRN